MAANVEQNCERGRIFSGKPVYAYEWMRYHHADWRKATKLVDADYIEAMTIVPYFSGAKAIVLWGYEPAVRYGAPYEQLLPLFMKALSRIATLSEHIGRGELKIDEPANKLWNAGQHLVRQMLVGSNECIVMAIEPWQSKKPVAVVSAKCGGNSYDLKVTGRRPTLAHIKEGKVALY